MEYFDFLRVSNVVVTYTWTCLNQKMSDQIFFKLSYCQKQCYISELIFILYTKEWQFQFKLDTFLICSAFILFLVESQHMWTKGTNVWTVDTFWKSFCVLFCLPPLEYRWSWEDIHVFQYTRKANIKVTKIPAQNSVIGI